MKTRKSIPRTALPRIYFIDRQIASGKYPNTNALAAEYETSMSTVSRDIEFMKDSLGAPIEYDALRRGYYYTEKTFRLPAGFTTAEDMLALGMAKTLLTLYHDTPLYDAAQNLLESITAPLMDQVTDRKNSRWYENRIVVPPVAGSPVSTEIWNAIIAGLRENRIIAVKYRGAYDKEFRTRRVRPYQLLFDNGSWYLYGYAEDRRAIRVFALSRMEHIRPLEDTFKLPPDYDYCSRISGSNFGVFAGEKKYRFSAAFYDEAALWVRERQWAADQTITETAGGVVISFTSTQYSKVLEWILSRGCAARPLAPEILVKDWKWHIEEMRKIARK
jgi:predicted DNA-binding transcriptional regulator YafY